MTSRYIRRETHTGKYTETKHVHASRVSERSSTGRVIKRDTKGRFMSTPDLEKLVKASWNDNEELYRALRDS